MIVHRIRGLNIVPSVSSEYFLPDGTIVTRPTGEDGPPGSVGVPTGTREAVRKARAAGETTYIINGAELYLPEYEPGGNVEVGVPVDVKKETLASKVGQESTTSRKLNGSEQRIDGEPGRPIVDPDGNVVTESAGTPEPVAGFTVPPWEQAGFDSAQAWIRAGRPGPFGRDDPGGAIGTSETQVSDTGSAVRAASAITTQRARQRKLQAAQPPVMRADSLDLGGGVDLNAPNDTLRPETDPRDIFNPDTPRPASPPLPIEPLVPELSPTPRPVKPGGGGGGDRPLRRLNVNLSPDKATSALIPDRTTSLSPSSADVQQNTAASGNEGNLTAKGALFPRKRKGGVRLGQLAPRPFG